jgi:transglutaminase-like putative cysteine protease
MRLGLEVGSSVFRRHRGWRFACIFALSVVPVSAFATDKVPDWVRAEADQKLPPLPEKARSVILLDEHTYTIQPNGQAIEHVRSVVKILRPQGREDAYAIVRFDKDSKVLSMHAWSIDPAGKEFVVKDKDILEVGYPNSGPLYDDARFRVAEPPGRDPGGVVAYEYELRQRPYVAETSWRFQDDTPRIHQSFTLVLPPGYNYSTSWANHLPVKADDTEGHGYRWVMNNEAAIDLERVPLRPSISALSARLTVHYSGPSLAEPAESTWQGIGLWYQGLLRDRTAATPEITAKAQELVAGKTDFYDRASAIAGFAQRQIRYFVIEMGIGGFQPHFAGDIYTHRYGDCKDKATLMAAMFSAVGIHSDLVLVDTRRGFIHPDAPSIEGDHAIGAIEIPAGYSSSKLHSVVTTTSGRRFLIFDPTWENTPFGQVENNLQGSYGVLVDGAQSELIQIPVMDPDLNTVKRTGIFSLAADGTLRGQVTDSRYGDLADRRRREYLSGDDKKQQTFLERNAGRDLMVSSLSGIKVENMDALSKELTTRFEVQAPSYATQTGPLIMVRPRVLGSYEIPVDHKPRGVAIDLFETMAGTDDYEIDLPEGYVVDELPEAVKEDFGFATYQSSTVLKGRTLHYSRRFIIKAVTLPANQYAEVQKLASVIGNDEASQVVLKKQ